MPIMKRVVCLANSRKIGGRCIAGREWTDGKAGNWIRPVSERDHQEVSEDERWYEDGRDPRVLDVIDIPLLEWQPQDHQTENWLLDPAYYWVKVATLPIRHLGRLADVPKVPLWRDGHSTRNGENDKVLLEDVPALVDSLKLIHVSDFALQVGRDDPQYAKRRVRGHFALGRTQYRLVVTDPVWEQRYLAQPDGRYPIGACHLTISLGEPYRGGCYKLIAAIIPPQGR